MQFSTLVIEIKNRKNVRMVGLQALSNSFWFIVFSLDKWLSCHIINTLNKIKFKNVAESNYSSSFPNMIKIKNLQRL